MPPPHLAPIPIQNRSQLPWEDDPCRHACKGLHAFTHKSYLFSFVHVLLCDLPEILIENVLFAMAACEKAQRRATTCQRLKHFTFLEETVHLFFLHVFGGKNNARVTQATGL